MKPIQKQCDLIVSGVIFFKATILTSTSSLEFSDVSPFCQIPTLKEGQLNLVTKSSVELLIQGILNYDI